MKIQDHYELRLWILILYIKFFLILYYSYVVTYPAKLTRF